MGEGRKRPMFRWRYRRDGLNCERQPDIVTLDLCLRDSKPPEWNLSAVIRSKRRLRRGQLVDCLVPAGGNWTLAKVTATVVSLIEDLPRRQNRIPRYLVEASETKPPGKRVLFVW